MFLQFSLCPWFSEPGPSGAAKRFHQGSPSFVMSLALWGKSVLGCQEVHLGLPKGSVGGSTKVSPRFHQGCASFVICLVFWGRSLSARKVLQRVPPSLLHIWFPVPSTLSRIFLKRVSFGVFSHNKGLWGK